MTISITASACTYTGDGSTVAFDVKSGSDGIYFETAAELTVTLRTADTITAQTIATHYTVSGAGSAAGVVTFLTAPASGVEVRIERNTVLTQTLNLTQAGAFSPPAIMGQLDKHTRAMQDLRRIAGGSGPGVYNSTPMTLDPSGDEWDADNKIIGGVADGTDTDHAVNYGQLQDVLVEAGAGDTAGAAASTDGEMVLFSGTSGKALKRSSGITGLVKVAAGVASAAVAGTDYLVGTVTQTGTGAVARSVATKVLERFTPEDFGAVGDGSTDDGPEIQLAINAMIAAGGGVLDLGPKAYRIATDISINNITAAECITIRGCGSATVLDFSGAITKGLAFNSTSTVTNIRPRFALRDFKIQTSKKNAGNALAVTYADNVYAHDSVRITGVEIIQTHTRLSDSGSDYGYWTKGVVLTNCRDATISDWSFTGEMDLSPDTSAGIELLGECTGTRILSGHILESTTGINIAGTCEGTYISDTEIVYCVYGVRMNIASGAEPVLSLSNCHINASTAGVYATNVMFVQASNCNFFAAAALNSGTWPDWYGIIIDGANSKQAQITGCSFTKESGRTGDNTFGVRIGDGSAYRITGNNFYGLSGNQLTFGISVASGVDDVMIIGNGYTDVAAPRITAGVSNLVIKERVDFAEVGTLTLANGANNDIVLADAEIFEITGPTGAFNITGFSAPSGSRRITIRNTTAQNMTLTNDATSTAANRIYTQTSADVALTGAGGCSADFYYSVGSSRWIMLGTQG